MLSFQQFRESLNWVPKEWDGEEASPYVAGRNYWFKHHDEKYRVYISHDEDDASKADVAFASHKGMHMTHDQGHHAIKVMAGVKHIVMHHLKQNPSLNKLTFSASGGDKGRVKLYRHLASKLGKTEEHVRDNEYAGGKKEHVFTVTLDKAKYLT